MQPEDIIELLESDNVISRRNGVTAYFEFLVGPKDGDSKGDNESASKKTSAFKHTKLWKVIRRRIGDNDEADNIIMEFFNYVMRRFKTKNREDLSDEELAKEKVAPTIQNLEAFAIWKCKNLLIDYERKMGRQKEKEIVTDLDLTILTTEDLENNNQKEIADCIKAKLKEFSKESPEGAEIIGMQLSGTPIAEIAKVRKKSLSATREYIRVSKIRARSYLAPCDKINTYSKAIKRLRNN